ncbi:hypothetical protein BT69DRAFT_726161 [Atractiella rhizophila]|nr:hypothetical protein BT69DRAFT_726161 [Atractiella rhizophila]
MAKFWIRAKEEPIVVAALGLTSYALYRAIKVRRRDPMAFNVWLRYRVALHGTTVALLLGGEYYWRSYRRAEQYGYEKYLENLRKERFLDFDEDADDVTKFVVRKQVEERKKSPTELREEEDKRREENGAGSEFVKNYRERRRAQLDEQKKKAEEERSPSSKAEENSNTGRSWWNVGGIFGRA